VLVLAGACSGGSKDGSGDPDAGSGSGGLLPVGGGAGGHGGSGQAPWSLPEGFTEGRFGGFLLGSEIQDGDTDPPELPDGASGANGEGCGTTIIGIVRDFRDAHPDFQNDDHCCGIERGIVRGELGADQKPVYAGSNDATTTEANFDQWYRTDTDVNKPYWLFLNLEPNAGVYTFHSDSFFPLDGAGFGNEDRSHNYHFTTEIHTKFRYKGGEVFRFTGDDDVFVFINGHLVIDIGGVHGATSAEVRLDEVASEIGIETGNQYDLDLFQAERRTTESNFRIDTTLELVDCGYVVPDVVR
jgi:fibro-slime domain-containing protein